MSFEKVLEQAIEIAENGFPASRQSRAQTRLQQTREVSDQPEGYQSRPYAEGQLFKNPDLARTLRKLVEAEKQNTSKGRHGGVEAARTVSTKATSHKPWPSFLNKTADCSDTRISLNYTAKVETPVSTDYRGYRVYKNRSNTQGPAE